MHLVRDVATLDNEYPRQRVDYRCLVEYVNWIQLTLAIDPQHSVGTLDSLPYCRPNSTEYILLVYVPVLEQKTTPEHLVLFLMTIKHICLCVRCSHVHCLAPALHYVEGEGLSHGRTDVT